MQPRATILVKLLLAFAVPSLTLFVVFGYVALEVTRRDLDAELGTRLEAVAASAATQVRGKYLVPLRSGDEGERAYQNVTRTLRAVSEATGARLYVFDRDFTSRADSDPGIAIGTRYYQAELDRVELERVFAGGATSSLTFEAEDGTRVKAGYAPVRASETEPAIVLVIGAQAPAAYFRRLDDLRDSLLWWGIALTAFVLATTFVMAFLITRPVRILAAAASRIGQGDLAQPIARLGRDELGVLSQTMETMRGQLAERDARMQQMLAGIAHEVRNPLAGIQLYAGILRDELAGDERAGHAAKIDREVGYLEQVVREFSEYARRPTVERAPLDAGAVVREVADLLGGEADAAGLELVLDVPADPVTLAGDASQLHRALLNLGKNAIQAATEVGERGRAVGLGARGGAGEVELWVWNRGAAIPEEMRARIFEPFFTTREKGTGLGLAFVSEIVRAHGGEVGVTSAGGETRFRVKLPRSF